MFTSIAATSCSLYQTYLTRTINRAAKRGRAGGQVAPNNLIIGAKMKDFSFKCQLFVRPLFLADHNISCMSIYFYFKTIPVLHEFANMLLSKPLPTYTILAVCNALAGSDVP